MLGCRRFCVLFGLLALLTCTPTRGLHAAERIRVSIPSSVDNVEQPCYVILPDGFAADSERPRPLLVSLHSWSADVEQRKPELEEGANRRGWIYLFPNFRGANNTPAACGSVLAQQDILDAVAWVRAHYSIDSQRIYLTGASGGGHMTLLMVGRHPELWAAASAWVGISDLAAWHAKHADTRYGAMMRACCGGAPGDSPEVDRQYRERSPIIHMHRAVAVPLDICAGIHDGHTGSVPIRHSLDAFNVLARAAGAKPVSEREIAELSRSDGRLSRPLPEDEVEDATFGRLIHLRRTAGKSRVTVFEGGHERIDSATLAWLERHVKPPQPDTP